MNSSKLDIILGPMFSGKTTKLLEIMDTLDNKNIKYIAVKPQIDDRYTSKDNNAIKNDLQVNLENTILLWLFSQSR